MAPGRDLHEHRRLQPVLEQSAPTALGVELRPGANVEAARRAIARALGPASGLEVATAATREASIDSLAGEGLGQLGEISTLLLLAAILALAAAPAPRPCGSGDRRSRNCASTGSEPPRLRRILLVESALMLGAGCVTGAVAGIYGQVDHRRLSRSSHGLPRREPRRELRPLEIFAFVIVVVLALVTIPGWFASRVSPMLALND